MDICEICADMDTGKQCEDCELANPCIGCSDYNREKHFCTSNGACGESEADQE